jgi:hypothetical protein
MPEHSARRMSIEQRLAEIIGAFCLDALSGAVNLNVDLDVVLCVLARHSPRPFACACPATPTPPPPDTLQRRFLDTPGEIITTVDTITVKLNRRAYSPILRSVDLPADTPSLVGRPDSASTSPDPGVDTAARKSTLPRKSTKLHEEPQALGIVRLALQRLGQPTAIQRLLPSMSWCAPSLETSSVQTSRRLPCRVLAGVTAGAAVSTYGVWMLPRSRSQ